MNTTAPAGYSGTPLAKKLGYKESSHAFLVSAPRDYEQLLDPLPTGVVFKKVAGPSVDIAHIFVTRREELVELLIALRKKLKVCAVSEVWSGLKLVVRKELR
jgi:hypothetical protein